MNQLKERFERRLAFEQIVSRMARNFVKLENADKGIVIALQEIGEFSDASRAYIFEFRSDGILMDNTFEWCQDGVTAEIENLKGLEINMFPWWMEKIKDGDILNIHDVAKLGPEAQAEREILEMQSIKSVLVMPLMIRGKLNGFVGFDNVKTLGIWQENDMNVLSIAAELFSNVFDRLAADKDLLNAKNELEASLSSLQDLQAQMVQQEQMVAVGQLAAGVAHEINNPLGYVISNQKTLQHYTSKMKQYANYAFSNDKKPPLTSKDQDEMRYIEEDLEELFSDIDEGLLRVKKIVKSLRLFSRIDSIAEFEPFDIREGIESTLVILKSRLRESVKLELDIQQNLPTIQVNGSKINQVLLNLIVNALDAIMEKHPTTGGVLKIKANTYHENIDGDEKNFIKVDIIDNGIGMSDDVLKKMFVPFFTTKDVGKGTGLGMKIVYDIVKTLHKGDIRVESVVGEGTTISILLLID
ncbi:MAG: ATP-binding protein [Bacillota bacterium]|nr:ATP-binding protein [Bacillota bacterium]